MTVKNSKSKKVNSAKKGNKKAVVENEVKKPTLKKTTSKVSSKPSEKKILKKNTNEVAPKKVTPKKEDKPKHPEYVLQESIAMKFPQEIDSKELGLKLEKVAPNKFTTYKELKTALDKGEEIFFVGHWNKGILALTYADTYSLKKAPKEFPQDLDITQAVLPLETMERVVTVSAYTEALCVFDGADLQPIPDVNIAGEKVHFRASYRMAFDIYVPKK